MALWKLLQHRFRSALELTFVDWLALLEAWLALFLFWVALRFLSAERLRIPSHTGHIAPINLPDTLANAERLFRLIELASRLHLLPMTCLPRSLTLRWMLARRQMLSFLRVGVSASGGQTHAHAWVEVNGLPVGESVETINRFSALSPSGKVDDSLWSDK